MSVTLLPFGDKKLPLFMKPTILVWIIDRKQIKQIIFMKKNKAAQWSRKYFHFNTFVHLLLMSGSGCLQ